MSDRESAMTTEKEVSDSVGFDLVLNSIRGSLLFQISQLAILLTFLLPMAFTNYNYVFIGYEPQHVCAQTNETNLMARHSLLNDTTAKIVYEMCHIKITSNRTGYSEDVASMGCVNGYSYHGDKDVSMKTEWDLVCEHDGLVELVQTVFYAGMLISTLTVSPLPDMFGRKPVMFSLGLITTGLEFGMTFSQSIYVVIAIRLLSGITIMNVGKLIYVTGTEILVTKHREIYASVVLFFWAFFLLVLGCIAFVLRSYSWRMLQLVSSLSGLLPLILTYFLNESLSWLFAKGRHDLALKIIAQACKTNGADFDTAQHAYNTCCINLRKFENTKSSGLKKSTVSQYNVLDIFRHRRLLKITIILCVSMFTHQLTYSGLYLTSATFTVNRFYMFMIVSGFEMIASVIFFVTFSHMGRRTNIFVFLSSTASCLLVSTCLVGLGSSSSEHISNASAAFFVIGKFAIDMSYNCAWASLIEHYPTTIRTVGIGISGIFSAVGGMTSPFLYPLFLKVNWLPGTMLTALCFITVGFYTCLPETRGKELPTAIETDEFLPERKENRRLHSDRLEAVVMT